jgi:catechol 2,3-dioxygenase-like lactoylglutathione lyase family enzyme
MIYELNHFGIVVQDLKRSLSFYEDVLGAKKVFEGFVPASGTDIVYLQIGDGLIELLHRSQPPAGERFGVSHIAFLSDDLDADYRRLAAAGHPALMDPKVAGTGVGRLAFVEDPNGARVELLQRDLRMRQEPISHPIIRSFDHYSLAASDAPAALGFYRDGLNMDVLAWGQKGEPDAPLLHHGQDVLELAPTSPGTGTTVYAHFALRVGDVDTAVAAFARHGVETVAGTCPSATPGGVASIADPDGVRIELLDRAALLPA